MSILVAYGSKRGGTEGLANMVAESLRQDGFAVDVLAARQVRSVENYEAVVVGGALYAMRWHRDARWLVKRYAGQLRGRPTYLFSSGPLDASAIERDIPPVHGVKRLIDKIGARGHATFGGRLAADAKGFPASGMAKHYASDWRDPDHVRTWVGRIAADLRTPVG